MGSVDRFFFEYVGNLNPPHREDPEPRPASAERRTNRRDRELMDWIIGQMEGRGFSPAMEHEFLHDLRQAIRQGNPAWLPDEKGLSRDEPS